jgi:hypothetical protein
MAAGAGLCGVCFWEVPANISGPSRDQHQQWESYASEQKSANPGVDFNHAGISPLKTFDGNFCTSAMTSFQSVGYTQSCPGVGQIVQPVKNDYASDAEFYCEGKGIEKGKCGEFSLDGEKCDVNPWNPMLDKCGATTSTSPPCIADKKIAGECFEAPITKNFCGIKMGPADMLAKAMEGAPVSPDCAQGREPRAGDDAGGVQLSIDGMADSGGTVSEARFLDNLSSR